MSITTTIDDEGIALITIDDGGKNVLSLQSLAHYDKALDEAADAVAIVTAGRDGVLSAGLDLKHVKEHGAAGARELVRELFSVGMRLWTDPRPTVCAATGHAIAGGTILAMAHDHVVAASGHWKWGLTETRVNMEVPELAWAIAGGRLSPGDLNTYVLPGAMIDAAMAVAVGYADELAELEDVVARAMVIADERAQLPAGAYGGNKARLRGDVPAKLALTLESDLLAVTRHLSAP
jgi:enoyl-CoA hydratase